MEQASHCAVYEHPQGVMGNVGQGQKYWIDLHKD